MYSRITNVPALLIQSYARTDVLLCVVLRCDARCDSAQSSNQKTKKKFKKPS